MTNGEGDMKLAQEMVDKFKSGTLHYAPWELLVKMFATTLANVRKDAREAAFKEIRARIEAVNPQLTLGSANGSMMKKCVLAEIDAALTEK